MAPVKDFETANAEKWETESNASTVPSALPQAAANARQNAVRPNQDLPTASVHDPSTGRNTAPLPQINQPYRQQENLRGQGSTRPASSSPIKPPALRGSKAASSPGHVTPRAPIAAGELATTHITNPQMQGKANQRRSNGYDRSRERKPNTNPKGLVSQKPKNANWAVTSGLVTARKENFNNANALREAEFQRLRSIPERNDEFSATGYYLWPRKTENPMKLFDPDLKTLDKIRKDWTVHIDWDGKTHCLRINSPARLPEAEVNVAGAMEAIKARYLDAKAQVILATPLYIVVPPTSEGIRTIIQPGKVEHREGANSVITSITLAGAKLSAAEKLKWESTRHQINEENFRTFRTHLSQRLRQLKNLRSWMRMRVQFGRVHLSQYQKDFYNGTFSFEMFANMMKKSRVTTGGTFDRKIDATLTMNLIQNIVSREKDFSPRRSNALALGDVLANPKHTEIIFITLPNGLHRLEAEIETVEFGGAVGKYQIGHTRLFENNGRNKRVEMTILDIESEFDWTLEIIQDSEKKEVPQVLRDFISASLNNRLTELTDPLGLQYPALALKTPTNFKVQSVVMRSIFQYQWTDSANILEVAIYREWPGCDTMLAPAMQASVSMYNPDWEAHMDSIENTSLDREWDPEMHNFFGREHVGHRTTGLRGLIAEIREIQRLLSVADEKLDDQVAKQKITGKLSVEKLPVSTESEVEPPSSLNPSFIGIFDDRPGQDGSLI